MGKKRLFRQLYHDNDKENQNRVLNMNGNSNHTSPEQISSSSPMIVSPKSTASPSTPIVSSSDKISDYRYVSLRCIGKGNFGDVYRSKDLQKNRFVAIKVINLDDSPEDVKQILREIHFLSRLKNPFIIDYIESFTQNLNMFIVMEYCGGGSCSDLLKFHKRLNEDVVSHIIRCVLQGLDYLHSENKVHRDIKSANLLLTETGDVKLGDFGVSTEITFTRLKKNTFVGTPFWMAPEVITKGKRQLTTHEDNYDTFESVFDNESNDGYDYKADIWSTGITTIELITGAPPLSQYDPLKILFEIPKKKPPLLVGHSYSDNLKDFIRYCLIKNPSIRPNSKKLLRHHFITKQISNRVRLKEQLTHLIQMKNLYNETHKVSHKPRFNLNEGSPTTNETSNCQISWNFTKSLLPLMNADGSQTKDSKNSDLYYVNKCSILFYCLERVYMRAKDAETKENVNQLIHLLCEYDENNPGLCHTLVDEIERYVN